MESFAVRVKLAMMRKDPTLTGAELARRCGIPQNTMARYLRGATANPALETLRSIAKCLEVDVEWLLGADVPMKDDSERIAAFRYLASWVTMQCPKALNYFKRLRALPVEKQAQLLEYADFLVTADETRRLKENGMPRPRAAKGFARKKNSLEK
jgi:transcriptional regulator with XRE-family HTH domain